MLYITNITTRSGNYLNRPVKKSLQIFTNDLEGRFIGRPNRFSVLVDTPRGTVRAHCPNPGRLQEILLPGTPLILEHADSSRTYRRNRSNAPPQRSSPTESGTGRDTRPASSRKTEWTLAAAEYQGNIIPLISVRANTAASRLILPRLFPEAARIRAEYTVGNGSRFDFLVEKKEGRAALVEVKSCTLSACGRAMFPDAPTERGRRHVEHLAHVVRQSRFTLRLEGGAAKPPETTVEGHIIFVLHHPDVELFTPNIHTDPAFSLSLMEASRDIRLHAVSLGCDPSGECRILNESVPFDFAPVEHVRRDNGAYLLLLELGKSIEAKIGSLGVIRFEAGSYLYSGSAKRNLSRRTARHLRRGRKNLHWHIDYLREKADRAKVFPIYTSEDIECELAARLSVIGGRPVPHFGSSDCSCGSHLFYFRDPPVSTRDFQEMLLEYRHGRI